MAFVLIKWLSEGDENKYTVLETKNILNFDKEEFSAKDDQDDKTYITWRIKREPPFGGWDYFDGKVIQISDNPSELKKVIDSLVEKARIHSVKRQRNVTSEESPRKKMATNNADEEEEQIENDEHNKQKTDNELTEEINYWKNESEKKDQQIQELQNDIKKLQEEINQKNDQLLKEIPALLKNVTSKANELKEKSKVELYPNSNVFVDHFAWSRAKYSRSGGCFISILLMNLFPLDVLLKSNLRGGASKIRTSEARRVPLDKIKIQALFDATLLRFPEMKRQHLGEIVNKKLGFLRYSMKKTKEGQQENS